MPMAYYDEWLRSETQRYDNTLTCTPAYQLILPADPDRFCVIITITITSFAHVLCGADINRNYMFVVNNAPPTLVLDAAQFGSIVTYPVYVKAPSGAPVLTATGLSYQPQRRRIASEYAKRNLSQ